MHRRIIYNVVVGSALLCTFFTGLGTLYILDLIDDIDHTSRYYTTSRMVTIVAEITFIILIISTIPIFYKLLQNPSYKDTLLCNSAFYVLSIIFTISAGIPLVLSSSSTANTIALFITIVNIPSQIAFIGWIYNSLFD